jgi:hypothetical protein
VLELRSEGVAVLLKKNIGRPDCQSVQYHKTNVVSGSCVFCTNVPQTNNQILHCCVAYLLSATI